ncbi:MAG TPA: 1-acyl-sn-glycerol-3-phosphate acyltransferase, partial [Chitinophagales bacterium]|nr:1-acyl-sn-glycerol-3-phosphate acyltransferase [Chitinophagales bacterium]
MPQTPLLYTVVKHWVRLGMSAYFKRYAITGLQHVPASDPIILAANHQNAFLDALAIAAHLNRPVHFMTRADVFAKPWVAQFFQNLNMLPIYRRRDGVDTIEMNKPIFEATARILNQNGAVVIFPEANQERKHNLRPLHKGFARMAFGAAEQNQF